MTIEEAKTAINTQIQSQAINTLVGELAKALVEIEALKAAAKPASD